MVINDLVQPVVYKLRQRTDLMSSMPYYIALAILDLTQNISFEQLKQTGPLANFIVNQAEYPVQGYDINGVTGNPFVSAVDHKITFIDAWFVYFTPSGVITPGQSTGKEIDKRDLRVVEPMSKILGIPSLYTIHGAKTNNGKIIVGQMPDNPYACQMRYQRQHPFNIPFGKVVNAINNSVLSNDLAQSYVYMEDDWSDIVVMYAAEKCAMDVGMNEIAQTYHQALFGYKDKYGSSMPGLVTVKQTGEQRNTGFNSRALRPIVRRFT